MAKQDKRPSSGPLLIDRLTHSFLDQGDMRRYIEHLKLPGPARGVVYFQDLVRRAHRFVLDDNALTRIAEIIRDVPEMIVRNCDFAVPVFDDMWIEFNPAPLYRIINGQEMEGPAKKVGYLISHNRVWIMVQIEGGKAVPLAYHYELNTEWTVEDQLSFCKDCGVSRMQLDQHFWGATWSLLDGEERHALRARHRVVNMLDSPPDDHPQKNLILEAIHNNFMEGAGDLRNLIAILLMLNRPKVTTLTVMPRRQGFIGNKLKPFLSHSVISINLDARETVRQIGSPADASAPKRRHEVRGHWCQNEKAKAGSRHGCIHEWRPARIEEITSRMQADDPDDTTRRWACPLCGGKRWWRKDHQRGHGGEGFVIQDGYSVTARKD
jgi:hypothetical protein